MRHICLSERCQQEQGKYKIERKRKCIIHVCVCARFERIRQIFVCVRGILCVSDGKNMEQQFVDLTSSLLQRTHARNNAIEETEKLLFYFNWQIFVCTTHL